jgi:hypothetical protein
MKEMVCKMLVPGNGLPCRHYIRPDNPADAGFCSLGPNFFCPEAMKHKRQSISFSRMTDFAHCKLRYFHSVIQGLSPKPQHLAEAIKLGRAWDAFIRHVHEGYDYLAEMHSLELSAEQCSKVFALVRAFDDLEIQPSQEGLLGCQYKIHVPILRDQIVGYVDRAYEDFIKETKLSSRPEFYSQRENVAFQLGTYFLGNEAWDYADVEITRVPALRTGQGKFSDEDPEAYEERMYSDILSRPAHYFLGWDRKSRTYGVRFWRSEFDLDEIHATYVHVLREIRETVKHGSWYGNPLACHVPAPCPYLPIKRSGVISEEIFHKRQVKGGDSR